MNWQLIPSSSMRASANWSWRSAFARSLVSPSRRRCASGLEATATEWACRSVQCAWSKQVPVLPILLLWLRLVIFLHTYRCWRHRRQLQFRSKNEFENDQADEGGAGRARHGHSSHGATSGVPHAGSRVRRRLPPLARTLPRFGLTMFNTCISLQSLTSFQRTSRASALVSRSRNSRAKPSTSACATSGAVAASNRITSGRWRRNCKRSAEK